MGKLPVDRPNLDDRPVKDSQIIDNNIKGKRNLGNGTGWWGLVELKTFQLLKVAFSVKARMDKVDETLACGNKQYLQFFTTCIAM